MLKVHLTYKLPSSWRILFRSGVLSRQFNRLKIFRSMVVPGGGCCKGVILQGIKLTRRFSCGRPVILGKKGQCNGSVGSFTQIE